MTWLNGRRGRIIRYTYYIIYYYQTLLYFALKLSSAQYEFPTYSQHGSRTHMIIELNDRDESFHYMCVNLICRDQFDRRIHLAGDSVVN